MLSTVSTNGIVTARDIIEGIEWLHCSRQGCGSARLGNDLVSPAVFVFNLSRRPHQVLLLLRMT